MSDLSFIDSLSDADVDALLANDVDSISDDGVTLLESLSDEQFSQITGTAQPEPAAPEPQGRQRLADTIGGFGFSEETSQSIADSPFTDFMVGAGRTADSTIRGLKQIASTPEEALALGKIEEKARKDFEEFDEGLGMEDVGEAILFIGSLAVPGVAPLKVAQTGSNILKAIKAVPGSLGGTSLIAGILEGGKAVTPDESRLGKAGTAAALTAGGGVGFQAAGGIIKNTFKEGVMGKVLSALGMASVQGSKEARRRTTGGLASWFNRKLFKGETKDDLGIAAGRVQANAERQGQTLSRQAAEAKAREASNDGLAAGDPVWDAWFDLIKGPRGKTTPTGKPGRRRKASGLGGARPSKTQGDLGKLDVAGERNRIVSTLMTAAQKEVGENGQVLFDVKAARTAWDTLKKSAKFKKVYTSKLKSGEEKLNKTAQSVEDFLDNLLIKGTPDGTGVSVRASTVLAQGAEDIVENGLSGARRIRQAGAPPKGQKPNPDRNQINAQAAGVTLQQMSEQELLEDAEQNIAKGGWFGFMDYFDTLEEQARKAHGVQ
jgi:hypothetical protein